MSLIFLNFLRMFANSLSTRACSASLLGALRMSWMKMFSPRIPVVAIVAIGVGRTRALFAPSFLPAAHTRARLEVDTLQSGARLRWRAPSSRPTNHASSSTKRRPRQPLGSLRRASLVSTTTRDADARSTSTRARIAGEEIPRASTTRGARASP